MFISFYLYLYIYIYIYIYIYMYIKNQEAKKDIQIDR